MRSGRAVQQFMEGEPDCLRGARAFFAQDVFRRSHKLHSSSHQLGDHQCLLRNAQEFVDEAASLVFNNALLVMIEFNFRIF